jgi:hypothetical protein
MVVNYVTEKMNSNRLVWACYEGLKSYNENNDEYVGGHPSRGRPKKRWIDCVEDDMRIKAVSMAMTSDRREWKKKTCCAEPT